VKKLPSYLKGLVESRARSAGDLERLERLRARIDEQIAEARKRLEAADTLIVDFNPVIDPSLIAPVHGRRPRVGKVKEVIDQVLREAAPQALPTPEIAFAVAERIEIRFSTAGEYRAWSVNCVYRALHKKMNAGEVMRQQTPGEATYWKLVDPAPISTLDALQRVRPVAGSAGHQDSSASG
jgi:hypothetical protein